MNALLRLGEDLFPGQDRDMVCVCGRAAAAGGTSSLVCGALWHTVVAGHKMMVDAWRRVFARAGILQPATGEAAATETPCRGPSQPAGSHTRDSKGACATLATSDFSTGLALAVPSTPSGTQARPPPPPIRLRPHDLRLPPPLHFCRPTLIAGLANGVLPRRRSPR